MLGLFGALDMGARSLSVQQEEMTLSGQNMANANSTSYADEQLIVSESDPLQTPIGQEGTGVQMTGIQETRDPLLDNLIRNQQSTTGSLTAQQNYLQDAEAYLDETISSSTSSATPSSTTGLAADLSTMFNAFQSLSTDPSNSGLRQAAAQGAQQVAQQFQLVSKQLSGVQSSLNTAVQTDVASANQDLSTIASLNQQIVTAEASGGSADQLVDQREATMENLAGLANFSASTQSNGAVNISIGGVAMVTGITAVNSLQTYDSGNGQLLVQDTNSGSPITLTGGSIEGEITTRDGALASLQSGINTLASQLITQVNSVYSGGYDLNGNTGQDLFTGTGSSDIAVNSNVLTDPSTFQAAGVANAPGDNTVALGLAQLADQNLSALGGQTFSANYAQTVSALGNSISNVNSDLATSQGTSEMLTNERSSSSGVNLDTEMTNMIQYQKAYEASAELITTLNQMLQTTVSMKTT